MKKQLLILTAGVLCSLSVVKAQAPRFVLFEHFTQASCGPCAAQNPGFESSILIPNPDVVRHVAYHTSWPGVDPMYNYNSAEIGTRTTFYGVTGVPEVHLQGNYKEGNPGAFSQDDVDNTFNTVSPIKITVTEVDNGSNRDVTVNVLSVGTAPAGSYTLYVAVVEDPIDYGTPPGNNGETHFPNVFRKMLPGISGDPITLASVGNTVTKNFNYVEDAANWNLANIKVVAFVQHNTTKEILNVGTVNDPTINYTLGLTGADAAAGSNGNISTFNLGSMNTGSAGEDFVYTLTTDAPGNWSANFTVGASTYTTTGTVNFAAGASNAITINVTPGATPAVATYTLTVTSVQNPTAPPLKSKVYVISDVTDMVVSNTGGKGDGTGGNATIWEASYTNGLTFAGNTGIGKTTDLVMQKLAANNALGGVNNIYFNAGWTFPTFTSDNVVAVLENFMDAGGNLMICGQDVGWDTWETANGGNGTAATQSFYTNYLNADFVSDGVTGDNSLNPNAADPIFGAMSNMTINNYYGGSYFFPDNILAVGIGQVIFTYPVTTRKGGVRSDNGTYKTVYIAPGMEMFSTTNANNIVKITHDWFYSSVSTEEFDAAMENLGQNYPNPANETTTIPVENMNDNSTLVITDMSGKTVYSTEVKSGTSMVVVPVKTLGTGLYLYYLSNESGKTESKRMSVVR